MFPDKFTFSIAEPINYAVNWLVLNYGDVFEAFSNGILWVLLGLEGVLRGSPWWYVLFLTGAITYIATERFSQSLVLIAIAFFMGVLGLWDQAMQTLALMLIAIALSVMIGLPCGVALSKSNRLRMIMLPILDAMQTLPSFVYLIPALMLFGLGKVPAIIATVIYAVVPVIRLTDLGIRQVDQELLEAARAFGTGSFQRLFGIELPLAFPTIMAGINQTTMMALAMVVLASMIGARGLGEEVLLGIQRLDVGRGLTAGLAIVALAIVLDRITQGYGKRVQSMRRGGET